MHASSAREAPYWGSGISTCFDKKPREHRAAFVIGSLEAAEEVRRQALVSCSSVVRHRPSCGKSLAAPEGQFAFG